MHCYPSTKSGGYKNQIVIVTDRCASKAIVFLQMMKVTDISETSIQHSLITVYCGSRQ